MTAMVGFSQPSPTISNTELLLMCEQCPTYDSVVLIILSEDNTFLPAMKGKQISAGSNWITSSEIDALIYKRRT
jgi:hypothetical protein